MNKKTKDLNQYKLLNNMINKLMKKNKIVKKKKNHLHLKNDMIL